MVEFVCAMVATLPLVLERGHRALFYGRCSSPDYATLTMPNYCMCICRLTMSLSEPRRLLSVPHDCKFVYSRIAHSSHPKCPKVSYVSAGLVADAAIMPSLWLSRIPQCLADQHHSQRDVVLSDWYHLRHDRIRFASSVVCRTASLRPASAPNCMMHVDVVEAQTQQRCRSKSRSRSTHNASPLDFPIFPCLG